MMSTQQLYMATRRSAIAVMAAGILAILLILCLVPQAESQYVPPPPACYGPDVETIAATKITATTATLNGELKFKGSSAAISVAFVWGKGNLADCCTVADCQSYDCNSSGCIECQNHTSLQAMLSTGTFSFDLSGLEPETTYYFRAKAIGCGGSARDCGVCLTFTTGALPTCISPDIKTNEATSVTATSAVLNGTLLNMGTPQMSEVKVAFEWGTDTTYGQQTPFQTLTEPGSFSYLLEGLNPETDMYFRAIVIGCQDETLYGLGGGFTTGTGICESPEIETNEATEITETTAQLNGTLLDMGSFSLVRLYFEWGEDTTYGYRTGTQTMSGTGPFSDVLDSLEPETEYHFRAVAIGCGGTRVYGLDKAFTTLVGCISPEVETNEATQVEMDMAVLNGTLLDMGIPPMESVTVFFEWGEDETYGNKTSSQRLTEPESFNALVIDLESDTPYHFRAVAIGCAGTRVYGNDVIFFTLPYRPPETPVPPDVETGSPTGTTETSVTLNGSLLDMGNKSYTMVYFEWGPGDSSSYEYTTKIQIMTETGDFMAVLNNLKCSSLYHYRAVGVGNGTDYGKDVVFGTITCGGGPIWTGCVPPTVETGTPMDITTNSAILMGEIENLGTSKMANVSFEWDNDPEGTFQYETADETMSGTGTFAMLLQGLTPDTTYYYRAKVVGDCTGFGDTLSFTTRGPKPDVITKTAKSEEITSSSAVLEGKLESMGTASTVDVLFEWGPTMDYGYETDPQEMTSVGDFKAKITGLDANTVYHFRAKGIGDAVAVGQNMSFKTEGKKAGVNIGIILGPILAALIIGFFFFLAWRRRRRKDEEEEEAGAGAGT